VPRQDSDSRARIALVSVVGITTLLRLWAGAWFFGFSTGDDLEILQAGFMRALDYHYVPWGLRNLFVSDVLVSPVLWLGSLLGIESTRHLCWIATFPFVALASVNIVLVYLLASHWLQRGWAPTLAATLYAFHWLPLGYGSTVYPRTVSTTCILAVALLLDRKDRSVGAAVAAGALLGVGFAVRYSEAIFLLPVLGLLLTHDQPATDRTRSFLAIGLGFAVSTAVTVGLWDLMTWGAPFASLTEFARYILVDQASSSLQRFQPWYWYLLRLPKWLPLTVLPLFFGLGSYRWLRGPVLFIVLPLISLSLIHHKDMRYLQPIVPFVAVAVAGASVIWWRLGRRRAVMTLLVASLLFGVTIPTFVAKKSMAAVVAVRSMSAETGVRVIAASQIWAYGGTLLLPRGVQIRELGAYPGVSDLRRVVPGCQRVALYRDRLEQAQDIEPWLERRGFERAGVFEWGWSRPVVVFRQTGVHVPESPPRPLPSGESG
jgi:hypothetical protein